MRKLVLTVSATLVFLCTQAQAATISNCDEIERKVTVNNGGEIREHILLPGRSFEAYGPMVSAQVEKGLFVRMQARDVYCIRKGNLSLQTRRPYNSKHQ